MNLILGRKAKKPLRRISHFSSKSFVFLRHISHQWIGKICSSYKSGRGTCSAHYIREDVLRELVLERIQAVNAYIRSDVEGFQEEWLHYRRADQEREIREDQKRVEQVKKRLATLDVVMSRLYEDYALGEISKEKYRKMTADFEAEQERLKLEIERQKNRPSSGRQWATIWTPSLR